MSERRERRRRWGAIVAAELNVMPLMNLFVVLIPLLLLSAVFLEVSVIEMNQSFAETPPPEAEASLDLVIHLRHGAYVVTGNGIPERTIPREREASSAGAGERARDALFRHLEEIVGDHPGHRDVKIVAEETTRYEEIVFVMDVSRSAGLSRTSLAAARGGS